VTHAPASLEDASELLASLSASRRTIGLTGGQLPGGPAAVSVDDIVSSEKLNAIVEYAAPDQIVTVQAGTTLSALQRVLAEKDQRLAIDPAQPDQTTVGGLVASNAYGPLRTRFGTTKDLIVGMTIVRADGTRAHGGGKVVKNVAGFDIPKLMVGTYGTLAMIGSVTFRLHPRPRVRSRLRVHDVDAARVRELIRAMTAAQLEPSAVIATFDGSSYRCDVSFEGFERGVEAQKSRFATLAGTVTHEAADDPQDASSRVGTLAVKIAGFPSDLVQLHDHAIAPLHRSLRDARAALYPSVGVGFVSGEPDDVPAVLSALSAARTWAESTGGNVVLEAGPAAIRTAFDPWGSPPPSFALMRALKDRFDPQRLLAPGGFIGGL